MSWSKEAVYDEQIAPLMTKIIAICNEHQIPMVAQFQYEDSEERGPGFVTTTLPFKGIACEEIRDLAARMSPRRPAALAATYVTNPDGTKGVIVRRV